MINVKLVFHDSVNGDLSHLYLWMLSLNINFFNRAFLFSQVPCQLMFRSLSPSSRRGITGSNRCLSFAFAFRPSFIDRRVNFLPVDDNVDYIIQEWSRSQTTCLLISELSRCSSGTQARNGALERAHSCTHTNAGSPSRVYSFDYIRCDD